MKKSYTKLLVVLTILMFPSLLMAQLQVFSENFEGEFPGEWTQESLQSNKSWAVQSGSDLVYPRDAASGAKRVYFYSDARTPAITRLITPIIDMSGLSAPAQLEFYYALPSFGATQDKNDTLRIYGKDKNATNWLLLATFATKEDFWKEAKVQMPIVTPAYQIAFEAKSAGGRGVVLDSVVVNDISVCTEAVTGLNATKITSNTATLTWAMASDYANYNLKIANHAITNFSDETGVETMLGLETNSYDLKNLLPKTAYYFYVQADCGSGDIAPWSSVGRFTTDFNPVEGFNESFENYPAADRGSISVSVKGTWKGFKQELGTTSGYGSHVFSGSTYAATGTYSVRMYAFHTITSGISCFSRIYLAAPQLVNTIDWGTKQLRFKVRTDKAYGKIHVGIAKHPDALNFSEGDFEELAVFGSYSVNTYEEKILPLNGYKGDGQYIIFYTSGEDTRASTYYYLDDIVLEDTGTDCGEMQILAPQANSITATGATLTWNGLNAASWNLKVSTQKIDPETTYADAFIGTVETTASHTLDELAGGMAYYAYVQPICAEGVPGKWSQPCLFFTEIPETGIAVPYFQNFDAEFEMNPNTNNGLNTPFPRGWNRSSNISTSGIEPVIYTTYYSSPASLRVRYSGSRQTEYSIFTLPKFVADIKDLQVRCKIKAGAATYNLYLVVGVVAADQTLTQDTYRNYTLVDTLRISGTEWEEVLIKFDGYEGAGGNIVFLTPEDMAGITSQQSIYIDDLHVEEISTMDRPVNLSGELKDNSTVSLTWESDAEKFEVLYGNEGLTFTDPSNQTQTVTGTTATIGSLQSNRTYDFYVRVKPDDGTISHWTGPVSFTTKQTPAVLPYAATFEDEEDNTQWTFLNSNSTGAAYPNTWRIGTAAKNEGSRSMYVTMPTNDNSYANVISYVYAYRVVDIAEAGLYDFGFTWKTQGETTTDFMRAFLVPDDIEFNGGAANGISATATPSGWITLGGKYNLKADWQEVEFSRMMFTEPGKYKFLFYWVNNATNNYAPAAAVDSVFVRKNILCMTPVNVQINKINDTNAELNFTAYNTPEWDFKLSKTELTEIEEETADVYDGKIEQTSFPLVNLNPETTYYYYLRTPCNAEWQKGSFTTKCVRRELSIYENFDDYGTGKTAFPACWTKLTNNTTLTTKDYPYINTTRYNGVGALDLYPTASTYNAAVSPMLDLADLSKVQIRLLGRAANAAAKLIVGAIADPNDPTSFFPIETLIPTELNTWESFEVPFDRYQGDAKYIALLSEDVPQHFFIDSVVIEPIPACRTPRELREFDVDGYSAKLRWNGYGASAFNVKVSEQPIDPNTDVANVFDNKVDTAGLDLSGLKSRFPYYWYVQIICDEMTVGKWSKEAFFETTCPDYSLPVRENFDTYENGTGILPDDWCWNIVKRNGNYPHIYTSTSSGYIYSMPNALYFSGGSEANYQLITTPKLHVDSVKKLTVSFKGRLTSSNGKLLVGVMTDPADINTFVVVGEAARIETSSVYESYSIDLASYQGNGKYIAFSSQSGSSTNAVYIDDLVIRHTNITCNEIAGILAYGITDTVAEIGLELDGVVPNSYNLKLSTYPIVPEMEDGDIKNENNISIENQAYKFSGLQPETTYYAYVQSICGELLGNSYWASTSFTTRLAETIPYSENFDAATLGQDIRELNWSSYANVHNGNPKENLIYPSVKKILTSDTNQTLALEPKYTTGSSAYSTGIDAITPLLYDLPKTQMTFKYRITQITRNFPIYVGVLSDWSDRGTYTVIDTLYNQTENRWYSHLMNFSNYPDAKFVMFQASTNETNLTLNFQAYIDDVLVEEIPACAPAYAIRNTNVSGNTATFIWKAGNTASSEWKYVVTDREIDMAMEYAVDSLVKYTVKEGTANAPTCTISGLQSDTKYYFYITPACGNAYFPQGISFVTACDAKLEIPYYDDFSTYGTTGSGLKSSFPNCWYRENNASYATSYPYTAAVPTGMYGFVEPNVLGRMLNFYSTNGSYTYVATSEIDTTQYKMRELRARFKVGVTVTQDSVAQKCQFVVGIASSLKDMSTFVPIDTISFKKTKTVYEVRVPFAAYEGKGTHLAFKTNTSNTIYFGELNIEETPLCELFIVPQVVNRTDSSFTMSWNKGEYDHFEICYGPQGFDVEGAESIVVKDTFCVITGLTELTDYDFYIRGVCNESAYSIWTRPVLVRTMQTPLQIPVLIDFEDVEKDKLWQIVSNSSGELYPKWTLGGATATKPGERSLYLSMDGGVTSFYGEKNSKNFTFAYTTIELPEGVYEFSFQWKGTGDGVNYFLGAFLIPDSIDLKDGMHDYAFYNRKDTFLIAKGLAVKTLDADWTPFVNTLKVNLYRAGIYKFALYAETHDEGVPFAVDSISIKRTAPVLSKMRVENQTDTTATIDWLGYNADYYDVRVFDKPVATGLVGSATDYIQEKQVYDLPLKVEDLQSGTRYYIYVKANNGTEWMGIPFTTMCSVTASTLPVMYDFDGETGEYAFPDCWAKFNSMSKHEDLKASDNCQYYTPYIADSLYYNNFHQNLGYQASKGALFLDASINHYSMLISPKMTTELLQNMHLQFQLRYVSSSGSSLIYGVMETPGDMNTITVLDTIQELKSGWSNPVDISLRDYDLTASKARHFVLMTSQKANNLLIDKMRVSYWEDQHVYDDICKGYPYRGFGFDIPAAEIAASGELLFTREQQSTNLSANDTIVTLHLTVGEGAETTFNESIGEGDVFIGHGFEKSETGTYILPYIAASSCDSLVILNLKVHPKYLFEEKQMVCPDVLPYEWRGKELYDTGLYYDSLLTVAGYDSIYVLDLTVAARNEVKVSDAICVDLLPYDFNGKMLYEAGVYLDTLPNQNGCDSIIQLTLTVNQLYNIREEVTICDGGSFSGYGFENLTVPGEYSSGAEVSVSGCDSVFTLLLKVTDEINVLKRDTICAGETYDPGSGFEKEMEDNTEIIYIKTVLGANMDCDTVTSLIVAKLPSYNVSDEVEIEKTELPYTYGNTIFDVGTVSGKYRIVYKTEFGCDSIVNLTLTVGGTGLIDNPYGEQFSITPNPTKLGVPAYVNYDFSESEKDGLHVEIFNTAGLLIQKYTPDQYPVNAGKYIKQQGVYMIRITTGTDEVLYGRIIVL